MIISSSGQHAVSCLNDCFSPNIFLCVRCDVVCNIHLSNERSANVRICASPEMIGFNPSCATLATRSSVLRMQNSVFNRRKKQMMLFYYSFSVFLVSAFSSSKPPGFSASNYSFFFVPDCYAVRPELWVSSRFVGSIVSCVLKGCSDRTHASIHHSCKLKLSAGSWIILIAEIPTEPFLFGAPRNPGLSATDGTS